MGYGLLVLASACLVGWAIGKTIGLLLNALFALKRRNNEKEDEKEKG